MAISTTDSIPSGENSSLMSLHATVLSILSQQVRVKSRNNCRKAFVLRRKW